MNKLVLKRKHLKKMTKNQELANAISQFTPSLYILYFAYKRNFLINIPTRLVIFSIWIHLPFSVIYHYRCAYNENMNPLTDVSRRLDSSFIHASSFGIACGTAYETLIGRLNIYLILSGIFNAYAIRLHWKQEINQERNQNLTFVSIILYVLPIILHNDIVNFTGAIVSVFPSIFCFKTYILGGYSHSIFHLGLGFFSHFLIRAVSHE